MTANTTTKAEPAYPIAAIPESTEWTGSHTFNLWQDTNGKVWQRSVLNRSPYTVMWKVVPTVYEGPVGPPVVPGTER